MEDRIAELERSVRSLRRTLYAALAGALLLGGGAIAACKSKAKPMTALVFEDKGQRMSLDVGGLHFTSSNPDQSTTVSASGVFAVRNDPSIGERSSQMGGGSVMSSCQGSMAQVTADPLGAQILITDTKHATAELSASQGYGRLHLWAQDTRVEMTAEEDGGNLMLKQGSTAELSAFHDKALLELETHPAAKRISSLDK